MDPQPALLEALATQLQRIRQLRPSPWDRRQAEDLCLDCQDLADQALEHDHDDLGEALLAYSAYLSSFVEGLMVPNGEQLAQLRTLAEALSEAAERLQHRAEVADLVPEPAVLAPAGTVIWAVGLPGSVLDGLRRALERLGQPLGVVEQASQLAAAIQAGQVLAVAVHRPALTDWQALLAGVERKSTPALLCVGEDSRMAYRLQALRAGAEGYYTAAGGQQALARRMVDLREDHTLPYQVLIVDDDATITMFCETVLRHNGMQARVVNQPLRVFEALDDFEPDVILVDLYMPDVNGLELLALLRSDPRTLFAPVILLSGDDDVERRFDALHLGGDDFLTKPIRPRFLVAAVTSRARRARWIKREMRGESGKR